MQVTIDKSALNAEQRGYPYREKLEELLEAVAKSNPLLSFVCDTNCLARDWNRDKKLPDGGTGGYENFVYRIKVFQDGEELGSVRSDTRYRRSIGCEVVYGIESFRINKERGSQNTTYTKDLKVALRTAKKAFVARANTELYQHVLNNVKHWVSSLYSDMSNAVRWSLDSNSESMEYARLAYLAHKQGKSTVELPVKLKTVKDYDDYLKRCDKLEQVSILYNDLNNKHGYAMMVMEDGKVVCVDLQADKVTKYESAEALPTNVADKFVMFKVLDEQDAYAHLGVKLRDNFFYIAK